MASFDIYVGLIFLAHFTFLTCGVYLLMGALGVLSSYR